MRIILTCCVALLLSSTLVAQEKSGGWFGNAFKRLKKTVSNDQKAQPAKKTTNKRSGFSLFGSSKSNKTSSSRSGKGGFGGLFGSRKDPEPTITTATVSESGNIEQVKALEETVEATEISITAKSQRVEGIRHTDETNYEYSVGVISSVERRLEPGTSFKRHGRYQLTDINGSYNTGLPLPLFEGDTLRTQENRLGIFLRRPVALAVDQHSLLQIEYILELAELALERGRIRIHPMEGGSACLIHTPKVNVYIHPGSDLVIDVTDNLNIKLYALKGSSKFVFQSETLPVTIEEGQWMTIPLKNARNAITKDIDSEVREYFDRILSLPEYKSSSDFQAKMKPAQSFNRFNNTNWPFYDRDLSGVLCPFCGFGFTTGEDAKRYCPECYKQLHRDVNEEPTAPAAEPPPVTESETSDTTM